jgi:ferredoxin
MARPLGVLICHASLEALGALAEALSGVPALAAPGLCRQAHRVRAWVAGQALATAVVAPCGDACWDRLMAALSALGPFTIHRVAGDVQVEPVRFQALLRGKIRRALSQALLPPEAVRYRLAIDGHLLSRRALLGAPARRAAIPLPLVDRAACRSPGRCRRCAEACPLGAWTLRGTPVLDRGRCEGCGCCASACPTGALRFPAVSLGEVLEEVAGVLSVPGGPRVVLFDCAAGDERGLPGAAIRLPLPCVGMLSLPWLLGPLVQGAAGVLVLDVAERCRPWHAGPRVRAAVAAAEAVLAGLGIGAERVALGRSLAEAEQVGQRLAALPSLGRSRASERARPAGLAEILPTIAALGDPSRLPLSGEALPFGTVLVDRARCALCGVCASSCPTGALTYAEDAREARLTFIASACDACRACEAACPERAMTIRRELWIEGSGEPKLLHRGRVVRCRRCGEVVGSANLVRTVRDRLGGATNPRSLEHCAVCRMVANLRSARSPGATAPGSPGSVALGMQSCEPAGPR